MRRWRPFRWMNWRTCARTLRRGWHAAARLPRREQAWCFPAKPARYKLMLHLPAGSAVAFAALSLAVLSSGLLVAGCQQQPRGGFDAAEVEEAMRPDQESWD